ncbi:hypothetical protein BD413DRAFT_606333 [Trametes elegans]|nr:hypothetical protein BD413DRAFT_606333 [Trametes elegans]
MSFRPLELVPDWLTEGPITADDFRCTTPASTIFRMSFGPSGPLRHRESIVSESSDLDEDEAELDDDESDRSTFLWDDDVADDESDTVAECDPLPSLPKPPPSTLPSPSHTPSQSNTPSHSRTPSSAAFDPRAPWFMQIDPACLTALDDQLLQSPLDAFADLCYAEAVSDGLGGSHARAVPGGYSWRRLSRLLSACPDLSHGALDFRSSTGSTARAEEERERGRESESDTDTDSEEQLASPEQPAPVQTWAPCSVYQPGADRQQTESPYRPYTSPALVSKPLPALPPPFRSSPIPCSPPPLYTPPRDVSVSQAHLALLFKSSPPPRPEDSVHFFPGQEKTGAKAPRTRRVTLRVSTTTATSTSTPAPWSPGPRPNILQRGLAGLRAGLSH